MPAASEPDFPVEAATTASQSDYRRKNFPKMKSMMKATGHAYDPHMMIGWIKVTKRARPDRIIVSKISLNRIVPVTQVSCLLVHVLKKVAVPFMLSFTVFPFHSCLPFLSIFPV